MPTYVLLMSRTTMQVSIYQSSEQQSSRVLIGSGNLEYAIAIHCFATGAKMASRFETFSKDEI